MRLSKRILSVWMEMDEGWGFKNVLITQDKIREILSVLKSNSTEGYPFLLKKAHNDVVISNLNGKQIVKVIVLGELLEWGELL